MEKARFKRIASKLTAEFGLDSASVEILIERAAMNVVKIARMEAYEGAVGIGNASSITLGYFISRLDDNVRGLFKYLSAVRAQHGQMDNNRAFATGIEEVLRRFAKAEVGHEPSRPVPRRRVVSDEKSFIGRFSLESPIVLEWRELTAKYVESKSSRSIHTPAKNQIDS